MTIVIPPPAPTIAQFVQGQKNLAQEVAERASGASGLSRLWADTFKDGTGIDSSKSSGYTLRGTPNFDVIRQSSIPSNRKLILRGNPADNDTAFYDWAASHLAVTAVGAAKMVSTQKKFGFSSSVFGGNGDYIECADNAVFTLGSLFTIDFWYRPSEINANQYMLGQASAGAADIAFYFQKSNADLKFSFTPDGSTQTIITSSTPLVANTWYHIAVIYDGANIVMYLNGVQVATTAFASPIWDSSSKFAIGRGGEFGGATGLNGYIDEFRISNSARWAAPFTPPVAAYSVDANTKFLLHMDAERTVTDSSASAHAATLGGGMRTDIDQLKFGSGALKFDGTSYITYPDSADWEAGTADFQWDGWFRLSAKDVKQYLWHLRETTTANEMSVFVNAANKLCFNVVVSGAAWGTLSDIVGTTILTTGVWYYYKLKKSGNTVTLMLSTDGVTLGTEGTGTTSGAGPAAVFNLTLGVDQSAPATIGTQFFNGWMDDFRLVNAAVLDDVVPTFEADNPTQADNQSVQALNLASAVTQVMMFADVVLNSGTATYYVSSDDGTTWQAVADLKTIVNVNSGTQIRIRVVLTVDAQLTFWGVAA